MAFASEIPRFSSAAWFTAAHHSASLAPQLDHVMLLGFVVAFATAVCYLQLGAVAEMNCLTLYGLISVSLMLLFYALEDRSRLCVLGFAIACLMGSIYGFLQGAWPFGLVEAIWSLVAVRRWWLLRLTRCADVPV
jgi:hypothetical protein